MVRIPWSLCPEVVREVEQRLYELSRIYFVQARRCQGFKMLESRVCGENVPRCVYVPKIVEASERGKRVLEEMFEDLVRRHPVYDRYLKKLPGLGVVTSGLLLGTVHPWRFETVSKLWAWAGLAPPEYYLKKCGNTECFNRKGKHVLMMCARFLSMRAPFYRSLFSERVREEIRKLLNVPEHVAAEISAGNYQPGIDHGLKRQDIARAHGHAIARAYRFVAKIFASQYWEAYRRLLDLPVRPPYVVFAGIRGIYYPPIIYEKGREVPLFG